MTDIAPDVTESAPVKQAHPVRGVLWGLMFGLGLAIVLVVTLVITLALVPVLITIVAGTIIGTLWSIFGPAKKPKADASEPEAPEATEEPAQS